MKTRTPLLPLLCSFLPALLAQSPTLGGFTGLTTADGGGMAKARIDADTIDDVVYGVFSAGAFQYRIGFDLQANGNPATTSPLVVVRTPFAALAGVRPQGADLAVGNIGGGSRPDLVLAVQHAPAGANTVLWSIGWDLDVNGVAQSWSPLIAAPSLGWEGQGTGCALADIDRNGRVDLLLTSYDNPAGANSFRYVIGWNLQANGMPAAWSPMRVVAGVGAEGYDAAAAVLHLDADPRPEMLLIAQDNGATADEYRYRIGWNVGADGLAQGWSEPIGVYERNRAAHGVGVYATTASSGETVLTLGSAQQLSTSPELNAFAFKTAPAVVPIGRRYRLVGDLHCITHTSESGMFNDRDEFWFKMQERFESRLTQQQTDKTVRLSDPHPEDYFQMWNGRTLPELTLWQGVLFPGDRTVLSLAALEQDNSNLDDLLRILPSIAGALVSMAGAATSTEWLTAAATVGVGATRDMVAAEDGRDFVGAVGVSMVHEHGRIVTRFRATQNTTVISGSLDSGAVTIDFTGAGAHYRLANLRLVQEPMTAGYFLEDAFVRTVVQRLHAQSPSTTASVARSVMANNWDDAVGTLLGAFVDNGPEQQLLCRYLPLALREAARAQGYRVNMPDLRADYLAHSNQFVPSASDQARVRRVIDLVIARLDVFRLGVDVITPIGNRQWDLAADELLDAVYDAIGDADLRDATFLVIQHMPYALRYLFSRMTGNAAILPDPMLLFPTRRGVLDYR